MANEVYDNEALWKLYSPMPNPWFSTEIVYEGWGVASFEKPTGTIEGKTKVTISEAGNLDVAMEYEDLNTDAIIYGDGDFKFLKFLQGDLSKGNRVGIGSGNVNPCTKLVVTTENGIFASEGKVFYTSGLDFNSNLKFFISEGTYHENMRENPKYWVLPLVNFISSFHLLYHPELTQHPLRLFKTPKVPEMEDEKQKNMALFAANRANHLIGFYFGSAAGYIQPVIDYEEKDEMLQSGKEKKLITALMISEVNENLDAVWFPFDYTNLISFATGIKTCAPWIEFRDENGQLVSRKHILHFDVYYEKGYGVINQPIHGGLGQLISTASKSSEFGKSYFRVLVGHLVRLQSYSRQIEDHMDLLCRTFDTICEEFGYSIQNLSQQLPADVRLKVDLILSDAGKRTRELIKQSDAAVQPILQQIESRIANSKNTDRAFGLSVIDLLKKYDLPDKVIMEKFYAENPEAQHTSWAQILTKYRGAAVHTGYFANEKYNVQDILILEDHLHDILIRIVLKILDYQGAYQPRVISYLVDGKTVNWLLEDMLATKLGYKVPII